ncbi:Aspartic-type endopeptidase-like protein [Pleurostoma richardsiae]|uniref:Aspartic-type endopeptidase-like protein n=1 Tax=Pleurostoma richardsiae TaxID=41990 RepID=A0AA38RNW1_9PEZI|nr:Aspartic-type endopeptidase-like protein [Pleurostoma richardsiae]
MLSHLLLTGVLAAASVLAASENLNAFLAAPPGVKFSRVAAPRPQVRTGLHTTDNHHRLQALTHSRAGARSAAAVLGAMQRQVGGIGYENITATTAYGTSYGIPVQFGSSHEHGGHSAGGNSTLLLLLDTASSDTWAVDSGFECIDYGGDVLPPDFCAFGPAWGGGFQYGTVPHEHFYIQYGDGEVVYGPLGYVDVTVAGITVRNQTVALANQTYWYGDNVTSGVVGLAYPSLTNAYWGDGDEHSPYLQDTYLPLFTNMVQQGLEPGVFTIAISRNSSGGVIAFGGVPYGLPGMDYTAYATCDIIITNLVDLPYTAVEYSFYTVIPDGFMYGGVSDRTKYPFIVDTGTTLIYLPPSVAEAINNLFDPPGEYMWGYGAYFTACDAVAPPFAVVLDGQPFYVNPVDMIYRGVQDPISGLCMTAVTSGGTGPFILGSAWLQNVVATFDVDNAEMTFVGRRFY